MAIPALRYEIRLRFDRLESKRAMRRQTYWQQWQLHAASYYPMDRLPAWAADLGLGREVQESFDYYATDAEQSRHRQYLYDITERVHVEPTFGWVTSKRRVLADSLYYAGFAPFSSHSCRQPVKQQLSEAVSLRDTNEGNYWHFLDDILPKLSLIDTLPLSRDIPILVGERLWNSPFFVEARTVLKRNWFLHKESLAVDRLIVPGAGSLRLENLQASRTYLTDLSPSGNRKVFVTRAHTAARCPANIATLERLAAEQGYDIIDPAHMSVDEQRQIFSEARTVAGPHGAGFANLIWRLGEPCRVLEIFPADFIHPHFAWLAAEAGWEYDAIVGSSLANGFEVSEAQAGSLLS